MTKDFEVHPVGTGAKLTWQEAYIERLKDALIPRAGRDDDCHCPDGAEEKCIDVLCPRKVQSVGCRKRLATGQWWTFCGETDMGQTLPALCTECGGEYKLR